jgi:hypothetical protein
VVWKKLSEPNIWVNKRCCEKNYGMDLIGLGSKKFALNWRILDNSGVD